MQPRSAEYNPKRFSTVIMRIREPKTTALLFASGKVVCTGQEREAVEIGRLEVQGFQDSEHCQSCDVRFTIRLEGLACYHGSFSSYEPELFPGLIFRMRQPKVVLLIFVSGKIVLTGAKKRDEMYSAFENIFQKKN